MLGISDAGFIAELFFSVVRYSPDTYNFQSGNRTLLPKKGDGAGLDFPQNSFLSHFAL